jgi:hypothetical protein
MFSRGYISREDFLEVGHKILRELGWNESHILQKIERDVLRKGGYY